MLHRLWVKLFRRYHKGDKVIYVGTKTLMDNYGDVAMKTGSLWVVEDTDPDARVIHVLRIDNDPIKTMATYCPESDFIPAS